MAMVFRRLLRLCEYYGARPTFVFCSATIGNPVELCNMLSGLEVHPILESGAARGGRHMIFVNPEGSPAQAAIQLLRSALERDLRVITSYSIHYTKLYEFNRKRFRRKGKRYAPRAGTVVLFSA